MKVLLMYPDRDCDLEAGLPPHVETITQDLELDTLFEAMAQGDKFVREVARKAVLSSLYAPGTIRYRQEILADCLAHPETVRQMYAIAIRAIDDERKEYFGLFRASPDTILHRSVQVLELFVRRLRQLKSVAEEHAGEFQSQGFRRFFGMLTTELNDDYFRTIEELLRELTFPDGILLSAVLGEGNQGARYVLRRPRERGNWWHRLIAGAGRGYGFQIAERDEAGFSALAELRGKGLNEAANVLAQSTDHILGFFQTLRAELAFYIGALNLYDRLVPKGEVVCFPDPYPVGSVRLSFQGLYDVSLALKTGPGVVGNDVNADGKNLIVITGANQGGKSTFLRGLGLAQVMMQCGLFVGARRFQASVRTGVFTHYKREEDPNMKSGKLDEELSRMSAIVDMITPHAMLLCNESFASTNEREGSALARQVVQALLEAGIQVVYVTHLFDLAHGFYAARTGAYLFLRVEVGPDGLPTFRLAEGEPLPTSHGAELYSRIFETDHAHVGGDSQ